jgi:hypothetical protein
MSNKNPFEIRSDILGMAKEYMDRQHEINVQYATKAFETAVDAGKVASDQWKQYVPQMYSMEDLMKKAQELYGFVTKKD